MPRVLHVCRAVTGGLRRHLETLFRALREAGWEVHLAAAELPEERFRRFLREQAAAGLVFHPIPLPRPPLPWGDLRALAALARLMRAGRFDAVHTHATKAGIVGRIAAGIARVPVVLHTPHGLRTAEPGLTGAAARLAERLAGRLTTRIVACSEGERIVALAAGLVPAERIVVARNGLPATPPRPPAEVGPGEGRAARPLIGAAGRFYPQKGYDTLLGAAARMAAAGSAARFLLAGEGPLEGRLRIEAARGGLADRVSFAPWQEDGPAFLGGLDVFALPSRYEGLPYALLESMAAGVPPVGADIPGVSEVIEDGRSGLLVPRGDAGALAQALLRLERDPALRRRLGDGARLRVAEAFREEEMARGLARAYAGLVG